MEMKDLLRKTQPVMTMKLKDMTTAELHARLKAVSGRAYKATNRTWLVDKITEVEAANPFMKRSSAAWTVAGFAPCGFAATMVLATLLRIWRLSGLLRCGRCFTKSVTRDCDACW